MKLNRDLLREKALAKGAISLGVLEDARASQLMRESFHIVEYLSHDIISRCVTVRVDICDVLSDLIV